MSTFKELLDIKRFENKESLGRSDVSIQFAAAILMFQVAKANGKADSLEFAALLELDQEEITRARYHA